MHYYLNIIKQFMDFSGRASRKEYWIFVLINIFIVVILTTISDNTDLPFYFTVIYMAAMIIPFVSATVRRLHDINKSAGILLVKIIPVVGTIWLVVLLSSEGDIGTNYYGLDPRGTSI